MRWQPPSNNNVRVALRNVTHTLRSQAVRVRHKEFGELFEYGNGRRLAVHFVPRLRHNLTMLDEVHRLRYPDRPGFALHPPEGDPHGQWSLLAPEVRRIVLRLAEGKMVDGDLGAVTEAEPMGKMLNPAHPGECPRESVRAM